MRLRTGILMLLERGVDPEGLSIQHVNVFGMTASGEITREREWQISGRHSSGRVVYACQETMTDAFEDAIAGVCEWNTELLMGIRA